MKGDDAPRVALLRKAAEKYDLAEYLVLLERQQTHDWEVGYEPRRRSRRWYDDDEEEWGDEEYETASRKVKYQGVKSILGID